MVKKIILMLILSLFIFVFCAWGADSIREAASKASLNGLIQYYSEMAEVEKNFDSTRETHGSQSMLQFIINNKDEILAVIGDSDAGLDIVKTHEVINRLYNCQKTHNTPGSSSALRLEATADQYFDKITKHRYVKNIDGTYGEYNKKGEYFRTVPADLPHLVKSRYVIPITDACYLLYSKKNHLEPKGCIALRAGEAHPDGCYLEKALVDYSAQIN